MGFWETLETLVGHSQEAGPFKESIEAIFAEAEGKDETIEELATDAAVSIAIDSVMAAKFGQAYEPAVKRKADIEAAIASIEKSEFTAATKDAFEAARKYGFSPVAAKAIAASGTVLVMPPVVLAAGGLVGDETDGRKPKPKGPKREPNRGHHVLNNGLKKVFGKMLGDFVKKNHGYFQGIGVLKDLIKNKKAGITQKAIINMSNNTPFGSPYDEFIGDTAVYTPKGETHNDPNDKTFGYVIYVFRTSFCTYMIELFDGLTKGYIKPSQLFTYAEENGKAVNKVVVEIISEEVFVDKQARGWWLSEQKGKKKELTRYKETHDAVVNLFSKFKYTQDSLCIHMVLAFYDASKKLNK